MNMNKVKMYFSNLRTPQPQQVSKFTFVAIVCLLILPNVAHAQITELNNFKGVVEKVFATIIGIMFLYGIVSVIGKLIRGQEQALHQILVLAGAIILWVAKDSILRVLGYTG